jgi:hypothetical protein
MFRKGVVKFWLSVDVLIAIIQEVFPFITGRLKEEIYTYLFVGT